MGALFLVRDDLAEAALATARAHFRLHGLPEPDERRLPGWRLLSSPYIKGAGGTFVADGDDFAAVAGTLAFDDLVGADALRALLAEATPPAFDWSRVGGQFALVLRKGGRTFVATDYFSAFHLYHDAEMRLFSTSLLAAATSLPRLNFHAQGVYEFAFQASVIGDDTVFAELKRLGATTIVELTADGTMCHSVAKPLSGTTTDLSHGDRLRLHRDLLDRIVGGYARQFGNEIHCPLSGGLDSRLMLAVLRAFGCRPDIYVYGPATSPDVVIAQQIGAGEGFDVTWIDKDEHRDLTPDAFAEQTARNFFENDALPNFGGMFDNGRNGEALHARHSGGALAVSGGCGEIYRNFFFLPDRRLTAANVVDAFFARFDARDATAMFDPRNFLRGIEDKMLAALERPGDRSALPRNVIEQLYPRVRCRSLFGREISIEGRFGPYLMPFLDHRIVAEGVQLPMREKEAGAFEAALLNAIDPVLARYPSAYGHDFATPPSLRHRFDERATQVRPFWLRRHSYALQRRLRPMGDEHGGLFGREYMGRVIDLEFPAMRRFFQIGNLADSGVWRRVACLEYLATHLGSRLTTS